MTFPRIRCSVDVRSREIETHRVTGWVEHVEVGSSRFRDGLLVEASGKVNATVGTGKTNSLFRPALVRRAVAEEISVWNEMLRNSDGSRDGKSP